MIRPTVFERRGQSYDDIMIHSRTRTLNGSTCIPCRNDSSHASINSGRMTGMPNLMANYHVYKVSIMYSVLSVMSIHDHRLTLYFSDPTTDVAIKCVTVEVNGPVELAPNSFNFSLSHPYIFESFEWCVILSPFRHMKHWYNASKG